ARLADAGGAEDREEVARVLRADAFPRVVERAPLAPAANDRDVGAARDLTSRGDQRVGGDRLRFPFELEPPLLTELDRVADESDRLDADQDLVRLGRLLQPRRHVDCIAGRQALLGTGDDPAGVDADAAADAELRE